MKLKKYNEFIKESFDKTISISEEEMNLFFSEPSLQKLIEDKKIELMNGKVTFRSSDEVTKNLLDQYLEIPGSVEERFRNISESIKDDDEFKKNIQSLKSSLSVMFAPLFIKEKQIREFGNMRLLEEGADSLMELLFDMWFHSIDSREDLDEEFKQEIIQDFDEALNSSRQIFINDSYQAGIESTLDFLTDKIDEMSKSQQQEDEDWRQPKQVSYEDMSQSEINGLIDQALDNNDFERVKFLSKFLETLEITDEVTECVGEFCERLLEIIIKYYHS